MRGSRWMILSVALAGASFTFGEEPPVCLRLAMHGDLATTAVFADGFERGDLLSWQLGAPTFAATEILDVLVEIEIVGELAGDHVLQLQLGTPDHHLYQTLTCPITTDARRGGQLVAVAGFPHPLSAQLVHHRAENASASEPLVMRFPVAGTTIINSSLYGTWSATALLDHREATCEQPVRFTLVR